MLRPNGNGPSIRNKNCPAEEETDVRNKIQALLKLYPTDLNHLEIESEYFQFKEFLFTSGKQENSFQNILHDVISENQVVSFPEMYGLLRILYDSQVIFFLVLKRVKNYLRNTLGQLKLNNLAVNIKLDE